MKIKCRAHISRNCYDGEECKAVYGEDSMEDDGLYDPMTDTVICDPCYIAGGQPSLDIGEIRSRKQVIDHVNREMGI